MPGWAGGADGALSPDVKEGPVGGALLDSLRSCTEAFFLGLQVRCLPSVAAASIRCSSRPSQDSDGRQLRTGEWALPGPRPPLGGGPS